jgi:predicted NAD/FAD-binding protein
MTKHAENKQKIAIIGSGISGLTCGYLLSKQHDITLFEANDYLGGHTNTEDIELAGKIYPVNTGFIVFNDWTYPNFIELMNQLGIASEDSHMSFSVRDENSGREYNGTNLNSLFAQRMNVFRPSFIRMILDILKFNKQTVLALQSNEIEEGQTLGEFVKQHGYSKYFVNHYIVPMGSAIWSASVDVMMDFPLKFFLKFFNNHGMLSVDDRPQWRVISGGSKSYIKPITARYKDNIHLNTPVKKVERLNTKVKITTQTGVIHEFDQVIFACHSDQALSLLSDATQDEHDVLSAIPFQMNDVVLHTDEKLMPKKKLAWAAWNYHIPQRHTEHAMVTYNMNMLQNFNDAPETILVTLNRNQEIDPSKIIKQYRYAHPVFTLDGMVAQSRHSDISNQNRTHYCGAYWLSGFHEDGVNSALKVCADFGIGL